MEREGNFAIALELRHYAIDHKVQRSGTEFHRGNAALKIPNDAVIVCTGGELPTKMLRDLGVEVEVHHGEVVA